MHCSARPSIVLFLALLAACGEEDHKGSFSARLTDPESQICATRTHLERRLTSGLGWPDANAWVAGDFNGDGLSDMAMAFEDDGHISIDVYLNRGTTFSAERWLTKVGGWPDANAWVVGDFNGDGRLDMAMAFEDDGDISIDVKPNLGRGFGSERWLTKAGGWPDANAWVAGDFNGDGRPDMAMAFEDDGDVSIDVKPNQGRDFGSQRWLTKAGGWPDYNAWVAGDFNGDGRPDMAMAFEDDGDISIDVKPNQGRDFGSQRWLTKVGGWPDDNAWVAGDFNGDGRPDMAMAFNDGDLISIDVKVNQGSRFGSERWATLDGGWVPWVGWLAADFDADGRVDIADAFNEGGTISIDVHRVAPFLRPCLPWAAAPQKPAKQDSELEDVESELLNGLTQSSTHWYWINQSSIQRVPVGGSMTTPVDATAEIPAAFGSPGSPYNHLGAGDYYNGRLYVPLSGDNTPTVLLAFDENLGFVGWGTLGHGEEGWVAVNPRDGYLYSSKTFTTLHAYDVSHLKPPTADALDHVNDADAALPYIGQIPLQTNISVSKTCPIPPPPESDPDWDPDPCVTWWTNIWIQGGDFSPNGAFYYVLDHNGEENSHETGVRVFDVTPFARGLGPVADRVGPTAPEITLAGKKGNGILHVAYNPRTDIEITSFRDDELEGVTVYRGTDGLMHVLLIELSNESEDDDVTVHHWITNEPDLSPPITQITTSGGALGKNGWIISPITVTLTAQDTHGTGIAYTEYSFDGQSWIRYSAPFVLPDGSPTLYYRSRDNSGNVGDTQHQTFGKIDTHSPASQAVSAVSGGSVMLSYSVTDPAPGSGPAGLHTVYLGGGGPVSSFTPGTAGSIRLDTQCTAVEYWGEDVAGNEQMPHGRTMDATPPAISASITGGAVDGSCTLLVPFRATVTDACQISASAVSADVTLPGGNATLGPPTTTVVQSAPGIATLSGSVLVSHLTRSPVPIQLTVRGTDRSGNLTSATTTVQAIDSTPPALMCPAPVTAECTSSGGSPATHPLIAAFLSGAAASDNCTSSPLITNNAPSFFRLGSTAVTFTAVDQSSNSSQCSRLVSVVDTIPPTITVSMTPSMLSPPNHKMVNVTAAVEMNDVCDPSASFVLTSITSSEPDNGLGDGDASNDIQGAAIGTPDLSFQLRAERSGKGTGRIYTIVYTATDSAGNHAQAVATVRVLH